jgi:hypothetical protein
MWVLAIVILLLPLLRTVRARMTGAVVRPPAAAD